MGTTEREQDPAKVEAWRGLQAQAQATVELLNMTRPDADLLGLAEELIADEPSLDPRVAREMACYLGRDLLRSAGDWDQRCTYHYATELPVDRHEVTSC